MDKRGWGSTLSPFPCSLWPDGCGQLLLLQGLPVHTSEEAVLLDLVRPRGARSQPLVGVDLYISQGYVSKPTPVQSLVYALHPGRTPPADLEQLEDDVGGGFRDEVRDVETPRQGSPEGVKQDALG